jgi:CDP-paratose synthetase
METILITGINGFLGSFLALEFNKTFNVIGLQKSTTNTARLKGENFKIYSSNDDLEVIFKENDIYAVLHVATIYKSSDGFVESLIATNVNLPVKLMDLCLRYNTKAFLNTDSFFNDPRYSYSYLSDYTLSKKHSLDWLKMMSQNSTCKVLNMKVFHMYGENDNPAKFVPSIVNKIVNNTSQIDMTDGLQKRDFIYLGDVFYAFSVVLNSLNLISEPFKEFEIGTGKAYSIKELVLLVKEISKSSTVFNFGAIAQREGEIMESFADNTELKKLGWQVNTTIEEGMSKVIDFENNSK